LGDALPERYGKNNNINVPTNSERLWNEVIERLQHKLGTAISEFPFSVRVPRWLSFIKLSKSSCCYRREDRLKAKVESA
jgi:hypothetical protein